MIERQGLEVAAVAAAILAVLYLVRTQPLSIKQFGASAAALAILGLALLVVTAACGPTAAHGPPVLTPTRSWCASSVHRPPGGPSSTPEVTGPCLGQSSIGGALVPYGLTCQEDEAISWIGIDRLGCVHAEGNLLEPTPW